MSPTFQKNLRIAHIFHVIIQDLRDAVCHL